jgi:hypothetical protein
MCLVLGHMAGALARVSMALLSLNILHLTVGWLGASDRYPLVLELLYEVHDWYDFVQSLTKADVLGFAGLQGNFGSLEL